MSDLTLIEESIKTHHKTNQEQHHKKNLKNPCRIHNGSHEWEDCRQNPKNQKDDGNYKGNNQDKRDGKRREEHRRTEGSN